MPARSAFSPRKRVSLEFLDPSRAKQSMKDECNINIIMGRYLRSGQIDHLAVHGPQYGDFNSTTLHEAMEIVRKAEQMFGDLPSDVRKRFSNEPREFLNFVQDEKNLEEAVKLGLAPRERLDLRREREAAEAAAAAIAAAPPPTGGPPSSSSPGAPGAPTQ